MMRSLSFLLVPVLLSAGPTPRTAAPGVDAQVTGLSLSSSGGTAHFSIAVSGSPSVNQLVLHDPERIVLDLTGATKADLPAYDHVHRGIVRDVRINQFRDNVVRVVLEVDQLPRYAVDTTGPGAIVVTFSDQPFAAWTASGMRTVGEAVQQLTVVAVDRTDSSVPAGAPALHLMAATAPPASQAQQQQQALLDFTFDNTPIIDALSQFAQYSGRSIVPGKDVQGTVSMTIKNATWEDAFHAFLDAEQLSSTILPGGIIRVDAPGALSKLDSTEVLTPTPVRLNYAKAGDVARSVQGLITKGRGSITADTATNTLVINDTRTRVESIRDFVKALDIKTPTIAISAKLIFVDRTDLEQLGVKYDIGTASQFFNTLYQRTDPLTGQPYNPNQNVVNLGGNAVSAVSNADALISGSALDLVFSTAIGGFSITSFLSALSQTELTDVEAQPTIQTLDNKQAQILSGEQTPVRVIDASSFGQANQAPRANVQFKETGIKLTVTPHVTANRQIVLDLEVERSSVEPLASADLGFDIPIQHSLNKLLVDDGQTAVIGGLTVTTVTRNRQGIPLLTNLPFIGPLFSYTTNQEHRQDLIILVTSRIIDDPQPN